MITKFEFLVQIEKSINLSLVNNADSIAFSKRLSNRAVISYSLIKSRLVLFMFMVNLCFSSNYQVQTHKNPRTWIYFQILGKALYFKHFHTINYVL